MLVTNKGSEPQSFNKRYCFENRNSVPACVNSSRVIIHYIPLSCPITYIRQLRLKNLSVYIPSDQGVIKTHIKLTCKINPTCLIEIPIICIQKIQNIIFCHINIIQENDLVIFYRVESVVEKFMCCIP